MRRSPTRSTDILDIEGVAGVAHEVGVPLIVDNTVATPYLIQPLKHGADIVVHSATKYLGGHGTAVAGVIVDGGTFDWAANAERFPQFSQPDPSYHGLVYTEALGPLAFIIKARIQLLRDLGAAVAPFNAFLIAQGLETLSLRIERHVQNAKAIAEWLEANEQVESVNYSGLPSSPWYERGQKYAPKGAGAVLSFEIAGGLEAGKRFVDSLELFSHVANIGDVRSLVIHPASTTHSQLTPEEQAASGVTPGLVRLAVGLEGTARPDRGPRGRLPGRQGRLTHHDERAPDAPSRQRSLAGGGCSWSAAVPRCRARATSSSAASCRTCASPTRRTGRSTPTPPTPSSCCTPSPVTHTSPDRPVLSIRPPGWWEPLLAPGAPLDPAEWFVVAPNVLGRLPRHDRSCVARAGRTTVGVALPAHHGARPGRRRAAPDRRARHRSAWAAVIGGSMGGMRSLEWAISLPRDGAGRARGGRRSSRHR